MKAKIVLRTDKIRDEVDSGVDLEVVGAVEVVSGEGAMRVVVAVVSGVDVAAVVVGVAITMAIGVVAEVAVVLEVVVAVEAVSKVEVVSKVGSPGVEEIITMDLENHGVTAATIEVVGAVLEVASIRENLSISQHLLRIKRSRSMINDA